MTITLARRHHRPPAAPRSAGWQADAPPLPHEALEATRAGLQVRRLDALLAALRRQGGCVSAEELCGLLRPHWDQPLSRVARWIAQRDVASVSWRGQVWLPLFQFERPSLDLVPAAADVVRTLRDVYDDCELSEWFMRPHPLLGGRCPASDLRLHPGAVKEAARLDRFINRW